MTRDELMGVAKRKGIILWTRSGVYERLSVHHVTLNGNLPWVKAEGVGIPPHLVLHMDNYDCVEVHRDAQVTVGAMLNGRMTMMVLAGVDLLQRDVDYKRTLEENKKIVRRIMES